MKLIRLIAGLILTCSSAVAIAVPITFDFTGSNLQDNSSRNFTLDGVDVTVTAGTFSSSTNPSDISFGSRLVDVGSDGLGADGGFFEFAQVDGNSGNDVLVFTFSSLVSIDSIMFGNVDGSDDFAFGTVDENSFFRFFSFVDVSDTVSILSSDVANAFGIGAIESNDGFTVTGLSVTAVSVTAVSEPGVLALLGLGLAGLGFSRRKANV